MLTFSKTVATAALSVFSSSTIAGMSYVAAGLMNCSWNVLPMVAVVRSSSIQVSVVAVEQAQREVAAFALLVVVAQVEVDVLAEVGADDAVAGDRDDGLVDPARIARAPFACGPVAPVKQLAAAVLRGDDAVAAERLSQGGEPLLPVEKQELRRRYPV